MFIIQIEKNTDKKKKSLKEHLGKPHWGTPSRYPKMRKKKNICIIGRKTANIKAIYRIARVINSHFVIAGIFSHSTLIKNNCIIKIKLKLKEYSIGSEYF